MKAMYFFIPNLHFVSKNHYIANFFHDLQAGLE